MDVDDPLNAGLTGNYPAYFTMRLTNHVASGAPRLFGFRAWTSGLNQRLDQDGSHYVGAPPDLHIQLGQTGCSCLLYLQLCHVEAATGCQCRSFWLSTS